MWSVLLAVSLGMLLLEVIPSSQQQLFDDNELAPTFVPPNGGRKRDVSDEMEVIAAVASNKTNPCWPVRMPACHLLP
ncbi:hypothetical protein J6590_075710 [Homalodisca vitripennis]|nr:hypothetical protein J6590_075710 [Homalodisca vitripennis]